MKKVLVLNADGQVARWVIEMLANNGEAEITLFLRHPAKIKRNAPKNAHVGTASGRCDEAARGARPGFCGSCRCCGCA
jgi:saccharopine dehydrogenase-like NADP-dependent oxidoreductase